jgi:hypothetical protein
MIVCSPGARCSPYASGVPGCLFVDMGRSYLLGAQRLDDADPESCVLPAFKLLSVERNICDFLHLLDAVFWANPDIN